MPAKSRLNQSQGFTLLELVVVIVLLGIVSVASTQFIVQGVSIYRDSASRQVLQQQGRFAVERMSRELRNALPGSVRVGTSVDTLTQCIEFMPVKGASTYLQSVTGEEEEEAITTLNVVDFSYSFTAGDLLAIFPIDNSAVYGGEALATLTGDAASGVDQQLLNLTSKLFTRESPTRRFYIVSTPVSFCAQEGSLMRHAGYTRTASQLFPPAGAVLLAENIRLDDGGSIDVFSFATGTLQRAAVIHMELRFSNTATMGDEWIRFSQEIFVRNTP